MIVPTVQARVYECWCQEMRAGIVDVDANLVLGIFSLSWLYCISIGLSQ